METGKKRGCLTAVLIAVGCVLGIISLMVGVFIYKTCFHKEKIMESCSEDGKYILTISSVGEPDWPFGAAHCELSLKQGWKRVGHCRCDIWNDGGWAYPENFAIQWDEEKVTVTISPEEGLDEKYELWFDGSVTSSTLYKDTATVLAAVSFLCFVYGA